MEQYKKWLEEQIEKCLNDKDLQREHWAYCTAYRKLIEALPIHGVMQAEGSDGAEGAAVASSAVGKGVCDGIIHKDSIWIGSKRYCPICDETLYEL